MERDIHGIDDTKCHVEVSCMLRKMQNFLSKENNYKND